ncbi:hypothetical protein LTR78_008910 [Recurvomyces mirabilis]|uniref:Uncharacterized protein n=1 Tax=Recurvomyces mirabilis TaxID=574656 RepID=A0AAE0WGT1_9PEZI|nr:hypothetical protein LTR78_008910 [Recurvomyces mirabilis]KAK5155825.1 hypothetical protein LTS14_005391 [Recurvomyces mirabilis]
MAPLPIVRSTNIKNLTSRPITAVFISATSGIGEATLRQLCKAHGKNGRGLRIYLVARNESVAELILDECRQDCPNGDFRFVKVGDLTLLRDVDAACESLIKMERGSGGLGDVEGRIDLLVLTQGFVRFEDPLYTDEGIEVSMSLLYYSRMRAITALLPLLTGTSGHPAHIISVYAAGMEKSGKFFPDDLSLSKDPKAHYSFANCRAHCVHMMTMYFESLAKQHMGKLSLVHVYPGLVISPKFWDPSLPTWFKWVWFLMYPFANAFLNTKPEESGQRTLFFIDSERFPARGSGEDKVSGGVTSTDQVPGGGAYSCSHKDEVYDVSKSYVELRKQGFEAKVWQHTQDVFAAVDGRRKFQA